MRGRLKAFFAVDESNPALIQAQHAAFSQQIPLLYFMLLTNTVALSLTHLNSAPRYLTVYIPAMLGIACIIRVSMWWRTRLRVISDRMAAARLRSTIRLAGILGCSFTAWALALFPYSEGLARVHVAFYMAVTVIGCIFCLMHLRSAALLVTAIVLTPFTLFFALTGEPVFQAIAINMVLVAASMIYILLTHYRDFVDLIESQKALTAKQEETQKLSDENRRLANIDSLTGLANRRRFQDEFHVRIEAAAQHHERLAIGIIDLDGFKPVNDAFGHAVGDAVLIEAGSRLKTFENEGVFAARLGGDEFGLIVKTGDNIALTELGQRICHMLHVPCHVRGISAKVAGSLGFAVFPDAGTQASVLFERADFALYHAKEHHRGQVVVFSEHHESEITRLSRIQQELQNAEFERELKVVFQPFVDMDTSRVIGFEALARWHSPALGAVRPDIFIPVAERCGIIAAMTPVLFEKALQTAVQWPADTRLSFNLSTKDIMSEKTVSALIDILSTSGFDPSALDFEVTETSVMSNFSLALENLDRLTATGAGIALDDFGVGQSSLGYVHRLPLRKVKIDRSFVVDICTNIFSQSIVRTIVDLSRNIGCTCIVEGMETAEQALLLRSLGCRVMQGYYFGRPMDGPDTFLRLGMSHPSAALAL
ncbi:putative bifunctional diguanylate cyclase/phosphodiesterase [Pararhizobium gei]|uniref:putative bifunctional diguanylate cyclase/phosphodiesterase n=1 Tax=Pararhizobium gei TaxID=1395951 RepID=UPI0023DAFAAD|nr:EAL domain-containing protein [Rhizobium gei]